MKYSVWDKPYLITKFIFACLLPFFYFSSCPAMEVPIYDFPIKTYSQNVNDYFDPDAKDYAKSLLSPAYQDAQLKQFYNHYYSSDAQGLSPWSEPMVESALIFMKKTEPNVLEKFNNQNKTPEDKHYAENFKEHDQIWWEKIRDNIDLPILLSSQFKKKNRAIAITNTHGRALPDLAPDFFHASLPGQGFPFDNLQRSAIWAGTPLYVCSTSKDKAWSLVLTPDVYLAWVKSDDIAYTSSKFIKEWQAAAQHALLAITQTDTSVVNEQQGFQFTGYIGAVFPMVQRNSHQTSILIPIKNNNNQAIIRRAVVNTKASRKMPLPASPKNLMKIIKQLNNRPYGWGGAFFFNDCSQEMKSIFTPFGIWLPRNSTNQAQLHSTLDLSTNNIDERISLLKERGHPLMTIIYINGHVMLYVGTQDINDNKAVPITYQNIWGMSPKNQDKRYVIGQSLFFPLLKYYPENPDISSLASKSNFKLIYLDKLNKKGDSPHQFASKFFPLTP